MQDAGLTRAAANGLLARGIESLVATLEANGLGDAYSVEGRVKSDAAIAEKLVRRPGQPINDLIGLRVIVDHVDLLARAVDAVALWADQLGLRSIGDEDRFEQPGAGGYRALHFDFVPIDNVSASREAGFEVQVTTALMAVIARVSHNVLYRRESRDLEAVARELAGIAEDALRLDERIAEIQARGEHTQPT